MEINKKTPLADFMNYFGLVMILIYLGMGLTLLMVPTILEEVARIHRYPLGLVLFAYGSFRLYKWIKKRGQSNA